jgi:hypothetical protein
MVKSRDIKPEYKAMTIRLSIPPQPLASKPQAWLRLVLIVQLDLPEGRK